MTIQVVQFLAISLLLQRWPSRTINLLAISFRRVLFLMSKCRVSAHRFLLTSSHDCSTCAGSYPHSTDRSVPIRKNSRSLEVMIATHTSAASPSLQIGAYLFEDSCSLQNTFVLRQLAGPLSSRQRICASTCLQPNFPHSAYIVGLPLHRSACCWHSPRR